MSYVITGLHDQGHHFYAEEIFEHSQRGKINYTARWGFNIHKAERFATYACAQNIITYLETKPHCISDLRVILHTSENDAAQYAEAAKAEAQNG